MHCDLRRCRNMSIAIMIRFSNTLPITCYIDNLSIARYFIRYFRDVHCRCYTVARIYKLLRCIKLTENAQSNFIPPNNRRDATRMQMAAENGHSNQTYIAIYARSTRDRARYLINAKNYSSRTKSPQSNGELCRREGRDRASAIYIWPSTVALVQGQCIVCIDGDNYDYLYPEKY